MTVELEMVACESPCPLSLKILKQIEFYFSDSNLPRDAFLSQHIKENDGWANLSTIMSFSRMKKLSEDMSLVINALKNSEMVELDQDSVKIRRKVELNTIKDLLDCTIYAKGFPESTTLDQVEEWLSPLSNQVKYIKFRREPKTKTFKGSIFIEFASKEEADRVASLEKIDFSFPSLPKKLEVITSQEKKNEENEETLNETTVTDTVSTPDTLTDVSIPEALNDSDINTDTITTLSIAVMTKLQYFEKKNNEKMNKKNGNFPSNDERGKRDFLPPADLGQVIKNSLLVFEGITPSDLSYKDLKAAIAEKYIVAFAEIEDGYGIVRLKDGKANEALEFYQNNPSNLSSFLTFETIRLATQEEEEDFLENFNETVAEKNKRQDEMKKKRRFLPKHGKFSKRQKRSAHGNSDQGEGENNENEKKTFPSNDQEE